MDHYFSDEDPGFHILKPAHHRDIEDFYNESGRRPLNKPSGKPSGNPSNKKAPENALTPYDIKDINTMKDEIIHDRFERHAHHT